MLNRLSLCVIYLLLFTATVSNAAVRKKSNHTLPPQVSLVVDYHTGKILHDNNSTTKIYPASLTKLMTLYLLFEAVESGKLSMNQKLYVSKNATNMSPSKLGLKEKEFITVREAILALTVKSANDVAVVVAENIKGTENKFSQLMNVRAIQLGMKDTYFKNSSGWHHAMQKTTARDLVKLSIAIKRDFPQYYAFFSKNSFIFRGNIVRGHNKVTETYSGAEGLKTGYTAPSGFNLVTTATRKNKSLVAVVTGRKSAHSRDQHMMKLLDTHFAQSENDKRANTKLHKPQMMVATNLKSNDKRKISRN